MEQQVIEQPELRIDALIKLKRDLEQRRWYRKLTIKAAEIVGFLGMFLCTNVWGFRFSVLLAAIAIIFDFYLQYDEWRHQWDFQQLMV